MRHPYITAPLLLLCLAASPVLCSTGSVNAAAGMGQRVVGLATGAPAATVYPDGGVSSRTSSKDPAGNPVTETTFVEPTGASTTIKAGVDQRGSAVTEVTTLNRDASNWKCSMVLGPDGSSATRTMGPDGSVTSTQASPSGAWCAVAYPDGTVSNTWFSEGGNAASLVLSPSGASVNSWLAADGSVKTTTKSADGQFMTIRVDGSGLQALPEQPALIALTRALVAIGKDTGLVLLDLLRIRNPDLVAVLSLSGIRGPLQYTASSGRLKLADLAAWPPVTALALDVRGKHRRLKLQFERVARL